MKNIILYGMRGTGKSTIGRKLALKLGKKFIDLDEYIEQKVGKNLAIFIEENGWNRFREIEHLCLKEVLESSFFSQSLLKTSALNTVSPLQIGEGLGVRSQKLDKIGIVLALGGGTIIFPRNQKLILKNNSKLIYIYSNLEEIAKRIEKDEKKGNKRNSLTGKSTLEELEEVYGERKEIYERFYDFQVINNGNIENTIFEIEKNLKKGNICVPITNFENIENQIEIINNSRKIKFVELRIDFLDDLQKLDEIISKIDKQIILTNRSEKEGGKFAGTAEENFEILKKFSSKVEYVDLEVQTPPPNLPLVKGRKEKTKLILSSHNFSQTSNLDELKNILNEMKKYSPDVCKIAVMPNKREDLETIYELEKYFKENFKGDYIFISMGELGKETRINIPKNGGLLSFGILENASAPGQIQFEELYDKIFEQGI